MDNKFVFFLILFIFDDNIMIVLHALSLHVPLFPQ